MANFVSKPCRSISFLAGDPHLSAQPEQLLALRAKVAEVAVPGLATREHLRIRLQSAADGRGEQRFREEQDEHGRVTCSREASVLA